jgi:hypothetical protein
MVARLYELSISASYSCDEQTNLAPKRSASHANITLLAGGGLGRDRILCA